MMPVSFAVWLDTLIPVLTQILGEEASTTLLRGWRLHAARPELVVVDYGVYDAGKSSLIKRMLIDAGQAVSDSLVVGAGPATREVSEVAIGGVILRDAPGLCTGDRAQDEAAEHALLGADVMLLILPPALLTGDRDAMVRVLSGQVFHPQGLTHPPGAVWLVVSRMDLAGIDPYEMESAYRRLCEEKRRAVQAQIAPVQLSPEAIHIVVPDAGGRVGNRREVARKNYDGSRAWDGMAHLTERLFALQAELSRLREVAGIRYFLYTGHRVLSLARQAEDSYAVPVQHAQRNLEQLQAAQGQLVRLVDTAKTDLSSLLEEELLAVARVTGADLDELRKRLVPKLEAAVQRWSQRHTDALAELAEELKVQESTRPPRPPAARLAAAIDPPDASAPPDSSEFSLPPAPQFSERLWKVQKHAQRALEFAVEAHLGMSFGEVRHALRKGPRLAGFHSKLAKSRQILNAQARDVARDYVLIYDFVVKLAPTLIEVTQVVLGIMNEAQEVKKRAAQAQAREQHLRNEAHKLANLYLQGDPERKEEGWLSLVDSLREEIDDARQHQIEELAALQKERSEHAVLARELQGLLDAHPGTV